MDAQQEDFALKTIEMAGVYRHSESNDGFNYFVFAAILALCVVVFYTGLMYLVLWSAPWWSQGADWLVGR